MKVHKVWTAAVGYAKVHPDIFQRIVPPLNSRKNPHELHQCDSLKRAFARPGPPDNAECPSLMLLLQEQ